MERHTIITIGSQKFLAGSRVDAISLARVCQHLRHVKEGGYGDNQRTVLHDAAVEVTLEFVARPIWDELGNEVDEDGKRIAKAAVINAEPAAAAIP